VLLHAATPRAALAIETPGSHVDQFSGSYTERVAFDIPAFHGIEPKLALSYNSAQKGGFADNGWGLEGFGVVERTGATHGVPRYESSDIFVLNGVELMPCLAGSPSPSCMAGGNYSTRLETFQKVFYSSSADTWTVTSKDGTRTVYTSILKPGSSTFRWGVASITDTSSNKVTFAWACPNDCYPDRVEYNGTKVTFYRTATTDSTYANGVGIVHNNQRLAAVDVQVSGARVRAYAPAYGTSAGSKQVRLEGVKVYDRNANVSATGVVSGTALPGPIFSYSDVSGTLTSESWSTTAGDAGDSKWTWALDMNGDGASDVVSRDGVHLRVARSTGSSYSYYTVEPTIDTWGSAERTWAFDVDGDAKTDLVTLAGAPPFSGLHFYVQQSTGASFQSKDFGANNLGWGDDDRTWPGDVNGDGKTDLISVKGGDIYVARSTGTSFVTERWMTNAVFGGAGFTWAADVNGDGKTDVVTANYSKINVALSTGTTFSWQSWSTTAGDWGDAKFTWPGDVNGDGMADLISANGSKVFVARSTGSAYVWETWTSNAGDWGAWQFTWPADVNGDGKTDVVTGNYSKIYVALSTGKSYLWQTWCTTAGNWGDSEFTWLVDMDGDGDSDIVTANGSSIQMARSNGSSYSWNSLGSASGFGGSAFTWLGYSRSSAAKGSGRMDASGSGGGTIVTWDYSLIKVIRPLPLDTSGQRMRDLLVKVKTELGGERTIKYQPSTLWPQANSPPPMELVQSVTERDGRGHSATSSFAYENGRFDRVERRFLGFRVVGETLPCINGETVCPLRETWFRQDPHAISKPDKIVLSDGNGNELTHANIEYETGGDGEMTPFRSLESSRTEIATVGNDSRWTGTVTDYDAYGNIVRQINYGDLFSSADDKTTQFVYHPNLSAYIVDRPASVTAFDGDGDANDPKLAETQYVYDAATSSLTPPTKGLVTRQLDWLDTLDAFQVTRKEYDAYGNVKKVTDALGNVSSTVYDTTYHQYPTSLTNALGQVTTQSWDFVCAIATTITEPNGGYTTTVPDDFCRPIVVLHPGNGYESRTYENLGDPGAQAVKVSVPSTTPNVAQFERRYFDGLGRVYLVEKSGPDGTTIHEESEYDARGNLRRQAAPHYNSAAAAYTTFSYDKLDRRIKVTHADGSSATRAFALDLGMGAVRETDELGRTRINVVDAFGRVKEHRELFDNAWRVTSYGYDARGNLRTIIDPAGNVTTYTWDSLKRRIKSQDPDLGTWSYEYDALGRNTRTTDARGQRIDTEYDALGRRTFKTTYKADRSVESIASWTYDEVRTGFANIGRLTTTTDGAGTATYDYDASGHQARATRTVEGTEYTFRKVYDKWGRLLGTRYPDGEVVGKDPVDGTGTPLAYDGAGRLVTVPGVISDVRYTADGQLAEHTIPIGTHSVRTYDPQRGWLMGIHTTQGRTTVQDLDYRRNGLGDLTGVKSLFAGESWSYGYDALERLTSATSQTSTADSQTWLYDALGNMTLNSRVGTYSYGAAGAPRPHAVTAAGASTYLYDGNGNMTIGGGRTITYDVENHPLTIDDNRYVYDGEGSRLEVITPTGTTIHLGDSYEVKGGVATKYFALAGVQVAKKRGTALFSLHTDHLGSIQGNTNSLGQTQRIAYRPYGERITGGTQAAQSRGFTGQEEDTTGLVYLHARYYDPALGRFLAADPTIPTSYGVGLNHYAYAANNPVNFTDIDGLNWLGDAWRAVSGYVWEKVTNVATLGKNALWAWHDGNYELWLRSLGAVAIIAASVVLTVASGGIGSPALYIAANFAIGFAAGAGTAAVMGASLNDSLKAGLIGGALSAAGAGANVAYKAAVGADPAAVQAAAVKEAEENGATLSSLVTTRTASYAAAGEYLMSWVYPFPTGYQAWYLVAGPVSVAWTYVAAGVNTQTISIGADAAAGARAEARGVSTLAFMGNPTGELLGAYVGGFRLGNGGRGARASNLLAIDPM
jgi:RHS repeat-associated protein